MVQKLQQTKVITKDGECSIQIDIRLDINVNENGVSVKTTSAKAKEDSEDSVDSVDWAIPDFTAGQKIKFGKEEK